MGVVVELFFWKERGKSECQLAATDPFARMCVFVSVGLISVLAALGLLFSN